MWWCKFFIVTAEGALGQLLHGSAKTTYAVPQTGKCGTNCYSRSHAKPSASRFFGISSAWRRGGEAVGPMRTALHLAKLFLRQRRLRRPSDSLGKHFLSTRWRSCISALSEQQDRVLLNTASLELNGRMVGNVGRCNCQGRLRNKTSEFDRSSKAGSFGAERCR